METRTMDVFSLKKELILQSETRFAYDLSAVVIDKPRLSVWMILIPIILVYHMYRHQQYAEGRKAFADNYLVTPQKALDAAYETVTSHAAPAISEMVQVADVPADAKAAYADWLRVLIDHYRNLLGSPGETYDALVRGAYRSRSDYLLFLNQLNSKEVQFNAALRPHLTEDSDAVGETIARIERSVQTRRRERAHRIFP